VVPFSPDNIDKLFFKKDTKADDTFNILIENNIQGLYDFFTAPNIRHKVKHPLFFVIRFSEVLSLFYNTNFMNIEKDSDIIYTL